MTEEFNPAVQLRLNGPLTYEFRQRIHAVKKKHRIGYWEIATPVGIHDSHLGNMTRYEQNVTTRTVNRLATVIAQLETSPPRG